MAQVSDFPPENNHKNNRDGKDLYKKCSEFKKEIVNTARRRKDYICRNLWQKKSLLVKFKWGNS